MKYEWNHEEKLRPSFHAWLASFSIDFHIKRGKYIQYLKNCGGGSVKCAEQRWISVSLPHSVACLPLAISPLPFWQKDDACWSTSLITFDHWLVPCWDGRSGLCQPVEWIHDVGLLPVCAAVWRAVCWTRSVVTFTQGPHWVRRATGFSHMAYVISTHHTQVIFADISSVGLCDPPIQIENIPAPCLNSTIECGLTTV